MSNNVVVRSRYTITLRRTVTEQATFIVDSSDEDDAVEEAIYLGEGGRAWDLDSTDIEVLSVGIDRIPVQSVYICTNCHTAYAFPVQVCESCNREEFDKFEKTA